MIYIHDTGGDTNSMYRNQTNLALKGIIGIQAMAVISNTTGHPDDASNHSSIAKDYIARWQTLGVAHDANPPHTTLSYGANETHGQLAAPGALIILTFSRASVQSVCGS